MIPQRLLDLCISALILFQPYAANGQSVLPKFEVASVKPWDGSGPTVRGPGVYAIVSITDKRVSFQGAPLKQMIELAYDVRPYQVIGPEWMATTKFEVQATIPDSANKDQVPEMLRALLVERFGLIAHRATSPQPVYGLVVSKNGIKFGPATAAPDESANVKILGEGRGIGGGVTSRGPFGPFRLSMSNGMMHFEYTEMTIADFAKFLSQGQVGLPVVDMTGLKGKYDMNLDVSVSDVGAAAGIRALDQDTAVSAAPTGSSFFSGLDKLGLKLESTKAPIEQIIVDHVEKIPSGN